MKPEEIVTSLDWSKKLEEAGWPQDQSIFWWKYEVTFSGNFWMVGQRPHKDAEKFAAPTAEEILRRLPKEELTIRHRNSLWMIDFLRFDENGNKTHSYIFEGDTLANAAAACYCYLAEQKLLTPK